MMSKTFAIAAVCAMALGAGAVAIAEEKEENEQKVEIQNLPAAVTATVESKAPGAKIVEAELEEENGAKLYSVEVKTTDGKEVEFEISPDGTLLKTENEDDDDGDDDEGEEAEKKIELGQAPAAVQAAITSAIKDGSVLEAVVEEKEGGQTVYEAEYHVANVEHSLKLAANGAVLEQENEVSTTTLPAEVSAAIAKKFPGAKIHEAEEVTLRFYELELVVNGKKREVKVFASGQVSGGDDDDDDDDEDDD